MDRLRSVVWLVGLAILALVPSASMSESTVSDLTGFAPGTLLVGFRSAASGTVGQAELDVAATIPNIGVAILSVPVGQELAIAAVLRQDPSLAFVEPDYAAVDFTVRSTDIITPNDPGWVQQWGPKKINAPSAWHWTRGSSEVVIAVLDSGLDLDHPDLADRLWVNAGETPANGIDDDRNGQIDDVWGWRFYLDWDGQAFVPMEDNNVADDRGHGTHVAGIAAAEIGNAVGIAGIAGDGRVMAVKVMDQAGTAWYSDIAQGIIYAVDNGARIINLSLGGATSSEALQAAVDYARAHDVLVVAAAGNTGGEVLYPAAYEGVLTVAATDSADQRPTFSNHGPQMDVAAPGVSIYSTWPWGDGYGTQTGTSMASPHVAGLAALLWSEHPTLTADQVMHIITRTAHDIHVEGWDPFTGWGRIDAQAAFVNLRRYQLDLSKEVTPSPGFGPQVTYTISIGNQGDVLSGVVVSDTLPVDVQFTSASPPATYFSTTHVVAWEPLTLTVGARVTMTVLASAASETRPCALITNTAYLLYDGGSLPLVAEAVHRALPCTAYLPLIAK